jgi:nucleotide-binding universal stress UspA family protein
VTAERGRPVGMESMERQIAMGRANPPQGAVESAKRAAAGDELPFRRILVPLDGSRLAETVLGIATRLADECDASIVLLHVIEKNAPAAVHGERHLKDTGSAEVYLAGLAQELRGGGRTIEWHTHEVPVGDVAASIADHALEYEVDLIVLCTHGSGGLRDVIWGSIAQQALQRSRVPVLIGRATKDTTRTSFAPQTIMVALDATPVAEAALPPAAGLARCLGAQLRLVMVVATSSTLSRLQSPASALMPIATGAILDLEEQQASDYLARLADTLESAGIGAVAEVRRGAPVGELAQDTGEHQDGLVVSATHGRAGLQAIWTSSVASGLLKRTRAPVLLIPIVES